MTPLDQILASMAMPERFSGNQYRLGDAGSPFTTIDQPSQDPMVRADVAAQIAAMKQRMAAGANTMNWEQSGSNIRPTGDQLTQAIAEAQRAQSQQRFGNSPFGGSFNRRFGAGSPSMLPGEEAVPPQVGPSPEEVAQLMHVLQSTAEQTKQYQPNQVTRQTGVPYAGPMIDASNGPLRSQPWYDEYVAASQAGGDTPMIRGGGGTPVDQGKQDAYRTRMAEQQNQRQSLVQQNALMESAARRQRMTGLTDPRYVGAMLDQMGGGQGGGSYAGDAWMYGPQAANAMMENRTKQDAINGQMQMNEANREQEASQFQVEMDLRRQQLEAQVAENQQTAEFQRSMMQNPMYWAAQGVGLPTQMQVQGLMGGGASGSLGLPTLTPEGMSPSIGPQEFYNQATVYGGNDPSRVPAMWAATGHADPFPQNINRPKVGGSTQPGFLAILAELLGDPALIAASRR